MDKEVGSSRFGRIGMYSFLIVTTFLSIFPFYWMFVIGSNTTAAANKIPPVIIPGVHFLGNLNNAIERIEFFRSIFNSFIVAVTVTISVLFFSSLAGFAFAKLKFKGGNVLFVFVLATLMVPVQLGIIPLYMLMSELGWVNSLQAVIVPTMVTAFGVFWMRQYIQATIHDELIEAGRIDGCSNFRLFWNIVIPSVRPGLATLGIIQFMNSWNDFLWPLVILKDQSYQTIQIALRSLNDAYYQDYAMVLAATFAATLPILIIFFIFSKQFIGGITEGAIK